MRSAVPHLGSAPLMPPPLELVNRSRLLSEVDGTEVGFSYVWGRVPAGAGRRCWSCDRSDRLERR